MDGADYEQLARNTNLAGHVGLSERLPSIGKDQVEQCSS